jgi:hypothetical protein
MAGRDFQLCPQERPSFSAARVTTPAPEGLPLENPYVAAVVTCLIGHLPDFLDRRWTISEALDRLEDEPNAPGHQLLVLDQFEEILTADPTDYRNQLQFFHELGSALDARNRWALVAMREDFMGGLDRYLRYIPGQLRSTFRLDLLDTEGARRAVQEPARAFGVDFIDDAADQLIADLQRVRIGSKGKHEERRGTYVEPVFLQVVCDSLWRQVHSQPSALTEITAAEVEAFGPLDGALRKYYGEVVSEAAGGAEGTEQRLRDWVEAELLTEDGLRAQSKTAPGLPGEDGSRQLETLQDRYLIRSEPRPNGLWLELSHDRLVTPVIEDNRAWREQHLERWQRAAHDWHRAHHDDWYLARGEDLRAARAAKRAATRGRRPPLEAVEDEFIARSQDRLVNESRLQRANARFNMLLLILTASVVVNVVLLILLARP